MVVVMVLVQFLWWRWFGIGGDGGIVMVVSVTAAIRVAVEISTNLFNCMFCGGICCVGSGCGGSDIWLGCDGGGGDGKVLVV